MRRAPRRRTLAVMDSTRSADETASAARELAEALAALGRLELELALTRVRAAAALLGVGLGLVLAAALTLPLVLAFLLAAVAAAIATAIPVWAALLAVTALVLLAVGGLAAGGVAMLRLGRREARR